MGTRDCRGAAARVITASSFGLAKEAKLVEAKKLRQESYPRLQGNDSCHSLCGHWFSRFAALVDESSFFAHRKNCVVGHQCLVYKPHDCRLCGNLLVVLQSNPWNLLAIPFLLFPKNNPVFLN